MRTFLALSLLVFFHFHSPSQNLYLTASGGYNFGINRSNFDNYIYNKLVGAFYTQNRDRFQYSLGKGIDFKFGVGYTTKHHIGFDLEFSYLLGVRTHGISQIYNEYDFFQKEISGKFYRINPGIHLIHPLKKITLRMFVGGLIGIGKMYFNQQSTSFRYENEFSGGYYAGFRFGIGMIYPLGERFNLSIDCNWVNAYFSPDRSRVTRFVSGNHDYTDVLDVWDREVRYFDSVNGTFSDPNEPATLLRKNYASSSIGLQLGIQWVLWKKIPDEPGK